MTVETKEPTVAPHTVIEEMAAVAKSYGYYLQYGVQLSYWADGVQYLTTVPSPFDYSSKPENKAEE